MPLDPQTCAQNNIYIIHPPQYATEYILFTCCPVHMFQCWPILWSGYKLTAIFLKHYNQDCVTIGKCDVYVHIIVNSNCFR